AKAYIWPMKLVALTAGTVALAGSPAVAANASGYQQTRIGAGAARSITVLTRSAHVRKGVAPIGLSCGSGSPCAGTLELQGSRAARGLYGRASFSLNAGVHTVVNVRLSSAGRQLLKTALQAVAWATVRLRGFRSPTPGVRLRLSPFNIIANHWRTGFDKF